MSRQKKECTHTILTYNFYQVLTMRAISVVLLMTTTKVGMVGRSAIGRHGKARRKACWRKHVHVHHVSLKGASPLRTYRIPPEASRVGQPQISYH